MTVTNKNSCNGPSRHNIRLLLADVAHGLGCIHTLKRVFDAGTRLAKAGTEIGSSRLQLAGLESTATAARGEFLSFLYNQFLVP